jgi:rubrerythrin
MCFILSSEVDPMTTLNNLKDAFAGESMANRKYLAFAKKAEQDGYPQVAKLFRAAAEAETVHAHTHLRVMGGINTTEDNLKAAIDGEGYEFTEMYPRFIAEASADTEKAAIKAFKHASAVEEVHQYYYKQALDAVTTGKDLPNRSYYICPVCGDTFIDELPDKCPVCGTARDRFYEVQ